MDDPVLAALIARADADPETLGLILCGSRGLGVDDARSDYDVCWLLADDAWERGHRPDAAGIDSPVQIDLWHECPRRMHAAGEIVGWMRPAYADARILFDRDGRTAEALAAAATPPAERAQGDAAAWLDGYLNAFYRSMKAARRGNTLGQRLQAAESILHLPKSLFALEGRWTPYHDRLIYHLDKLESQGWPPGYLEATFLKLLGEGDIATQRALCRRVIALMRARGHGQVIDDWDGQIEAELD